MPKPPVAQGTEAAGEDHRVRDLGCERMRAQVVTSANVLFLRGGGQDDRGDTGEGTLVAFPGQEIEPIADRHLKIHENDVRKRKLLAIREWAVAPQVVNRGLPVVGPPILQSQPRSRDSAAKQKSIIVAVFHQKNQPGFRHVATIFA